MVAARYLLALYGHSILTFLSLILLIELALFLLRPRCARLRYLVRLVPVVKLPIDLLIGCSSAWIGWSGIDPALEEAGSRILTLAFAWPSWKRPWPTLDALFHLRSGETFGWTDWGVSRLPDALLVGIASLAFAISILGCLRVVAQWIAMRSQLKRLQERSFQVREGLYLITDHNIPFSTSHGVFLPTRVVKRCSQEELEAIIAHEGAHIRWGDGAAKLILSFLGAFFWFLPFWRRWRQLIDLECERGCDAAASNPEPLLSALCKVARGDLEERRLQFVHSLMGRESNLRQRVDWLVREKGKRGPFEWIVAYLAFGWLVSSIWSL